MSTSFDIAKDDNARAARSQPDGTIAPSLNLSAFDEMLGSRLLSASPDCVKLIDLEGRVRMINETGRLLMEFDAEASPVGKLLPEQFPADIQPIVANALADARSGRVARFSGFRPTAHGTPKWWDVVISPVHDNAGHVICLMSVSRDITRQKAVEESLRLEEQRFRALADNIAQLAWMGDATGSLFWYNQRWFDYTGTCLEDMRGDGWTAVHHPDHLERVTEKYRSCIASGEIWEDTFPLRGKDGAYRWFLSRARPIRDANNRVVLWCGTNTDITEQRNSSIRLRQLARLIELSHESIIVWDFDGGIVLWNRGCEELYGYSPAEAIGTVSHDLLKTEHPMPVSEFDATLRRDGSWTGELLHTAKNGQKVWVDSRQELIRVGGRNVVLETNRDITERRRADDVRNLLVAELNHRVKNTLAIVQSVAGQTARTSETTQQFINRFNGRLQALSCAHNVLTDAHWVGAGVRDLVTSQLAVTVADGSRIEATGPDVFLPPQSALQLTLMIHELATNALKHGALLSPLGRVIVSWSVERGEPSKLVLMWRETGGPEVTPPVMRGFGMTLIERSGNLPHMKARLEFQPGGVECHIAADLACASDTELAYFYPGKHGQSFATPSNPSLKARHRQTVARRILIIEDDPMIGMEIEEILSDAGFHTLGPAPSADQALKAIATSEFDAAIVDGKSPGKAVDAVVGALTARNVPFVVLTGSSSRSCLADAGTSIPLVAKPIEPIKLISSLATVLPAVVKS